jgi:hypothetical protein
LARVKNSLGPIIGYHGCGRAVAEQVLANKTHLKPKNNYYDWLGPGIYFWVDSPERGLVWAKESKKFKNPYVIGAFIIPGLCLNLTDYGVNDEIKFAHSFLVKYCDSIGVPAPQNAKQKNEFSVKRSLDCAVIKTLHELREFHDFQPSYDTVYGAFEDGESLFEGSALREKTHVQIAVRNTECILGYFRVPGYD